MKKLLLILLCLPMIGFGQSWRYSSGGNDFDGKYRISYVTGTGNDWPYDNPQLVVNYWEDSKNLNLYISKAGYYIYDSGTKVYLSFSNENEMVYVCNDLSYSRDNEQVFMGDFYLRDNYNEAFDKIEIIEKLMNASYVNIRISNDYGKNTMKFSLRGSTKAIKFVIPDIESRLKDAETTKEENKMGCISGECEDGIGTYKYATGDIYVGEFKDGKMHGQGTYTYAVSGLPDGEKYVGEFKDGKIDGIGTFTSANGDKYVGEYKDNKKEGQGTFTWQNPWEQYVGEWSDGYRHGQGTLTRVNSEIQEGLWENDIFIGKE